MITSDHAPTIKSPPRVRDGRMPFDELPNWYATTGRVPNAPRPVRVPVEGQEILR